MRKIREVLGLRRKVYEDEIEKSMETARSSKRKRRRPKKRKNARGSRPRELPKEVRLRWRKLLDNLGLL